MCCRAERDTLCGGLQARRQIKKKEKQRKEIENMIFQSKKAVETEEKIKQQEVADAERALREEALRCCYSGGSKWGGTLILARGR